MSPKKGVGSPKASAGVGAFKRLSEIPGVLEEGKIFFFYRHSLFLSHSSDGAVRRVHYVESRASACAMIMSYTFCIMVPVHDHLTSVDSGPEGARGQASCAFLSARDCRPLLSRSILLPLCCALLRCTWSNVICHKGSEPFVLFAGQVLGRVARKGVVLSNFDAALHLPCI